VLTRQDGSPATQETFELLKRLLQRGFLFIPEGEHSNVLGFTPPLTITKAQLRSSIKALAEEIAKL
jgi:4-aminobutyrate aminotransferase-like enzyme